MKFKKIVKVLSISMILLLLFSIVPKYNAANNLALTQPVINGGDQGLEIAESYTYDITDVEQLNLEIGGAPVTEAEIVSNSGFIGDGTDPSGTTAVISYSGFNTDNVPVTFNLNINVIAFFDGQVNSAGQNEKTINYGTVFDPVDFDYLGIKAYANGEDTTNLTIYYKDFTTPELKGDGTDEPGDYTLFYIINDQQNIGAPLYYTIHIADIEQPTITLSNDETTIAKGQTFDLNSDVEVAVSDNYDAEISYTIVDNDNFVGDGTDEGGTYQIIYSATDSSNNQTYAQFNLTVNADKPYFEGDTQKTIEEGQELSLTDYEDLNISATDSFDGDLTSNIVLEDNDNFKGDGTDQIGTYNITYSVTDSSDQTTTLVYMVKVIDSELPLISGDEEITITEGDKLDINDPQAVGLTAIDKTDGDLSSQIVLIDDGGFIGDGTDKVGTYKLVYQVTDSSNNTAEYIILVNVVAKEQTAITPKTDNNKSNSSISQTGNSPITLYIATLIAILIVVLNIYRAKKNKM